MSEFGCFYNPRPSPGRCIKDTRSTNVENKCEISNGSCRLKSDQTTQKILVPTSSTANKSLTVSMGDIIRSDITNSTLSGPITAYSGILNGQKILLFGDVHFSTANLCSEPCRKLEVDGPLIENVDPVNSENCWELNRLFADIFANAEQKDDWVDFYIEIPFLSKGGYAPSQEDIKGTIKKIGMLYNVYHAFHYCFHKYNCKFDKTRFHYSDVRLEFLEIPEKIREKIREMNPNENPPPFETDLVTLQGYVMKRIGTAIQTLLQMMDVGFKKPESYIQSTDKIIRSLYFSGGMTMQGIVEPLGDRLFKIYLNSDNYAEDSHDLIKPILSDVDSNTASDLVLSVLMPRLTVNRRGKNMHRTRAQIEALEFEGKTELANKIKSYMIKRYQENIDNSALVSLWAKFMQMYQEFINPKTSGLRADMRSVNRLLAEYGKFSIISKLIVNGESLLLDGYVIARMFRSFPGKEHVDSNIKMVYAGDAHIDSIREFFSKEMGVSFYSYGTPYSEKTNEPSEQMDRCIKINVDRFL